MNLPFNVCSRTDANFSTVLVYSRYSGVPRRELVSFQLSESMRCSSSIENITLVRGTGKKSRKPLFKLARSA